MLTNPHVTRDLGCEAGFDLFREHVEWTGDGIRTEFGVVMQAQANLDRGRATLEAYLPPAGRAAVA